MHFVLPVSDKAFYRLTRRGTNIKLKNSHYAQHQPTSNLYCPEHEEQLQRRPT